MRKTDRDNSFKDYWELRAGEGRVQKQRKV